MEDTKVLRTEEINTLKRELEYKDKVLEELYATIKLLLSFIVKKRANSKWNKYQPSIDTPKKVDDSTTLEKRKNYFDRNQKTWNEHDESTLILIIDQLHEFREKKMEAFYAFLWTLYKKGRRSTTGNILTIKP